MFNPVLRECFTNSNLVQSRGSDGNRYGQMLTRPEVVKFILLNLMWVGFSKFILF